MIFYFFGCCFRRAISGFLFVLFFFPLGFRVFVLIFFRFESVFASVFSFWFLVFLVFIGPGFWMFFRSGRFGFNGLFNPFQAIFSYGAGANGSTG
jgi:hypothetical protein